MSQLFNFFILFLTIMVNGEFSAPDCRELGFVKGKLMCSSCEKLDDFGLETLKSHCRDCCTMDQLSKSQRRYPNAVLEVCTCKFRVYPQIEAFIKSNRPAKFQNLKIRYVRGLDPIVKLLDDNGQVKETLSIAKWNTDTVEEFFHTHLTKTARLQRSDSSHNGDHLDDEDELDFLQTNRV